MRRTITLICAGGFLSLLAMFAGTYAAAMVTDSVPSLLTTFYLVPEKPMILAALLFVFICGGIWFAQIMKKGVDKD